MQQIWCYPDYKKQHDAATCNGYSGIDYEAKANTKYVPKSSPEIGNGLVNFAD